MSPRIKIFARAHNLQSAKDLMGVGVKTAMPEIIESSFILGGYVLEGLGLSKIKINTLMTDLRADNYANVRKPIDNK